MNWQDIKTSTDNTHFLFEGNPIYNHHFIEVLKFHSPGLAPVKDASGSYHIDSSGMQIYSERYNRTFGYYCNRAAVVQNENWFHINEKGQKAYSNYYVWCGNYQEDMCTVRDFDNKYFHIDKNGEKIYSDSYKYAGDFKDGIACVKTLKGFYKHIDIKGHYLNDGEFLDLGIFHKNFATALDNVGWYHINKQGRELYKQRYAVIEPFYNGFALVTQFNKQKNIIDEKGDRVLIV